MIPELLNNYRSLSLGNTGTVIKSTPAVLCGYSITNINAAIRFVKLYNLATAPSASDTPFLTIGIPPGSTVSNSIPGGLSFSAGLSARSVTTLPDSGATGSAADEVAVHLFYQ